MLWLHRSRRTKSARERDTGIATPACPDHGELFTLEEVSLELTTYDLPMQEWMTDEARRFEVYVELWSEEPVLHLKSGSLASKS
jgi:hypothetical protein